MKKTLTILLLFIISIGLIACSRVTQKNFEKIQQNMTIAEVTAILGEPTQSDSVNIMGLSGTASTWKDPNAEINIQFLNNQVFAKSFTKANQKEESSQDQVNRNKN